MTPELIIELPLKGIRRPGRPACGFDGCSNSARAVAGGLCDAHQRQSLRGESLRALKSNRLTGAERDFIRQWYQQRSGKVNIDELAAALNRTKQLVCRVANELGLTNRKRTWPHKNRNKHNSPEDARRAISEASKRYIREHGHRRGMLGKKHTPQTLAVIARKSRERNARMSKADYKRQWAKALKTRLDRYGTAGPPKSQSSTPYSRTKGGKRDDIGGIYFRSAWEANYARYLTWLKSQGQIADWKYEPRTFIFHGVTRGSITYTPDFEVTENNGVVKYHEVKGWMDSKSRTKLKRMATHYPDVTIVLIDERQFKKIASVVSSMIPGWEGKQEQWTLRNAK